MMSLDSVIWLTGILAEAVVLVLLVYRRAWKVLPVFSLYCAWDLLSNVGFYTSLHFFRSGYDVSTYLAVTVLDSVWQFGVLVELTWSVLRPLRSSLPHKTPVIISFLIVAIGAAIWPFSGIHQLANLSTAGYLLAHLQQTVSILRVLLFLALTACSQFLSISWRDRELQVATGLGFYSLVSLGAAMLRSHETSVLEYRHLNQFVVASYLCSLLYWVYSFAQQEAERREFTPQMQNLLLAAAGVAREQRLALVQASMERHRQNS